MAKHEIFQTITLTAAGGTISLDVADDTTVYEIEGTATLGSSYIIQHSGTPEKGDTYVFRYKANITIGVNTLTIFGYTITDVYALKDFQLTARYNGAGWDIIFVPDFEAPLGTETFVDGATVIDETLTLAKTADLAQGSIISGQASNRPLALDASTDTYMLIGDGTDVNSVQVTGDITITNAGVVTIGNLAVETAMIDDEAVTVGKMADLARGSILVGATAGNRPTALASGTAGQILVGDGNDLISTAMSGDATIDATGALTIAAGAVEDSMIEGLADGAFIIGVDGTPANNNIVTMTGEATLTNAGVFALDTSVVNETHITYAVDGLGNLKGIVSIVYIQPATFKALLDSATNNAYLLDGQDIVVAIEVRVGTASGAAQTIDVGWNAAAGGGVADPNGFVIAANSNAAGSYNTNDPAYTYTGTLLDNEVTAAANVANGYITVTSTADLTASAFAGYMLIYIMSN